MSNRNARPRVAILYAGYVPEYRRRLYELLEERSDIEYVVFWGGPPSNKSMAVADGPFDFSNVEVRNRELRVGRKVLMYQPVVRELARGDFDAIVVGAWLRVVSSLVLIPLFKLRGRRVIFWGQGSDKPDDAGTLSNLLIALGRRVKTWLVRRGDGYLVYTEGGRRRLIEAGLPAETVFAINNTIDTGEQFRLHSALSVADRGEIRERLGLRADSILLLYVGSIYREKRLGQLIEAVRVINSGRDRAPIELVILGDGPDREAAARDAAGMSEVSFKGRVVDQQLVATYMRVAAAVVVPGAVGLVVNHALSQGRPVITRADACHGPEIEYLSHGFNGLIVDGDVSSFTEAIAEFVNDPTQQEQLNAGALASRQLIDIERMAVAFDGGVRRVLGCADASVSAADSELTAAPEPFAERPEASSVS